MMELSPRAVRFFNRADQPVGFMSDEELNRRQKVEAERAAAAETSSQPGLPVPESALDGDTSSDDTAAE
jgi:hypothetical protein